MAKGDVELVVRMRNEASKTLDTLTNAFDKLTTSQNKMTTGAAAAGSTLGKLAAEAGALLSKFDKTGAFEKMANEVINANAQLAKQEAALKDAQGAWQSYQTQMANAAAVQQRLRNQQQETNAALAAQKQSLKEAEKDYTALNKAIASGASTKYGFPTTESVELANRAKQAAAQIQVLRAELDRTQDTSASIKNQLGQVNAAYRQLSGEANRAERSVGTMTANIAQQRNELQGFSSTVNAAAAAQQSLAAAQDKAEASANRVGLAQRRAAIEIRAVADAALTQNRGAFDGTADSVAKLSAAMQQAGPPTRAEAQALRDLADASNRAKAAPAELSTAISLLNRELRNQNATTQSLAAAQSNVDAALKRTADAAQRMGVAMSNANNMVNASATATERLASASRAGAAADTAAAQGKRAVADALKQYNDGARRSLDFTQRLRGQVLSLAAAYLGLQNAIGQIGEVITAYQSLEAAQNRLGAVFQGDQSKVGQELDFLRRTADRLGISFQVLADEYGKFAVATNGTNLAGEDTRKIFLAVAEAGRVNKLSIDNMQGTYLALTQMVSKGKVQAEELRRQLGDRLPGAFNIMAAALGMTTAQLDAAMQKGEVTSDALSKFADELNKRFGAQLEASLTSTTTAIGKFQNNLYQTRLAFANGGFIEAFTEALRSLNEQMMSPAFQAFIVKLSSGLGSLIKVLAEIPNHATALTVAFSAFIGLKLAGYIGTVTAGFRTLVPQLTAATTSAQLLALQSNNSRTAILGAAAATRSWGTALQLLGGPVGIAIAAISTAIGFWATRTDTATEALTTHQSIVDKVKNAYEGAGKAAGDWSKKIADTTRLGALKNLQDLRAAFDDLTQAMGNQTDRFTRVLESPAGGMVSQEDRRAIGEMAQAIDDLQKKRINLERFREVIDGIGSATSNKSIEAWALSLIKASQEANKTEKAVREAELIVKALTGTAEESADAIKELSGAMGDTARPIADGTDALKKYANALNDLKGLIPSLAAEAKKFDAMQKIDKFAADVLKTGDGSPLPPTREVAGLISQAQDAAVAAYNKAIVDAAPKISDGVINRIVEIESRGNANARNPRSTAAGLGQFVDETWIEQFKKVFPAMADMSRDGILYYKTGAQNLDAQKKVLENFTQENMAKLIQAGINPTAENTYLAHFLGAGDAIKVILANPNELAKSIVQPASQASNPKQFFPGQTAGGLRSWAANLMGGGGTLNSAGFTQEETKAAELQKKQETALQRINKELDERINKQRLSNTEAEIANSLAEAGLSASSEEGKALANKIRDARATADAEERVNQLLQQRALIQEQIKYQQEQEGNLGAVQALQQQLTGVNTELNAAIMNAMAMWAAIGGPQAEAANQRLLQQQLTIKKTVPQLLNIEKLIGGTIDNIATQGTTAFMTLAEGIWDAVDGTQSWGEALRGAGQAFVGMVAEVLLGLAKMILQQAIYNGLIMIAAALGWYGPGKAAGAAATSSGVTMPTGGIRMPTNHSGGLGGYGGVSTFSTGSIMQALSYDSGGLGGQRPLASNETLSVLKEDEEVLTTADPRHRANGGAGGGGTPMQLKIVNAIDSASVIEHGLNTAVGERAIMNFMQANRSKIRGMLGN